MQTCLIDKQQALETLRKIADYQFGKDAGDALFTKNVEIVFSRTTGRVRYLYVRDRLLATLRPTDSMFSLTVEGAKRLARKAGLERLRVRVSDDAMPFVVKGKSVFAKHIIDADKGLRPQEEVIVLSKTGIVLAVGKAVLTGREMKVFRRGSAIRVRRGMAEK